MYLFSCKATAKKTTDDIQEGAESLFIVYINYPDLFGAEHLCKLYLMAENFSNIVIEKRKQLSQESINRLLEHDQDIQKALKSGFHLRLFECH